MKLDQCFMPRSGIELAFIFGSFSRGRQRAESDVDIAVFFSKLPAPKRRLDIRTELANKLSKYFGRDVDVVVLNNAGSILKYQVARDGKVAFERRKGMAKKFRLNAIKEYFDYLPTFNFHYNRLRNRGAGNGRRNIS